MDNPTSHQQMEDPALTQSSSLLHYSFCFRPSQRQNFLHFFLAVIWGDEYALVLKVCISRLQSAWKDCDARSFTGAEGEITELVFKMGACHYRPSQPSPHHHFYVSHLSHPESTVPLWNPMPRLYFLVIALTSSVSFFTGPRCLWLFSGRLSSEDYITSSLQ